MPWYDPRSWDKEDMKKAGMLAVNPMWGAQAIMATDKESDRSTTAQGGLAGAGTGFMVGGPAGAAVGGIAGLGIGYMAGRAKKKAEGAQKAGLQAAQDQLAQMKREAYQQRMADLNQAMQFFGPAQQQMKRLYGIEPVNPTFGGAPPGGMGQPMLPGAFQSAPRAFAGQVAMAPGTEKLDNSLRDKMQPKLQQLPGLRNARYG